MSDPPTRLPLPDQSRAVQLAATVQPKGNQVVDLLSTPAAVAGWLSSLGVDIDDVPISDQTLKSLRAVRDAIRRVFAHVTDDTRVPADERGELGDAVACLNEWAAARPPRKLAVSMGRLRIDDGAPSQDLGGIFGELAMDAIEVAGGEVSDRLRACYAPNCLHYFVANKRGREWCSTTCGNRARAARHYERSRAVSRPTKHA